MRPTAQSKKKNHVDVCDEQKLPWASHDCDRAVDRFVNGVGWNKQNPIAKAVAGEKPLLRIIFIKILSAFSEHSTELCPMTVVDAQFSGVHPVGGLDPDGVVVTRIKESRHGDELENGYAQQKNGWINIFSIDHAFPFKVRRVAGFPGL